jgi:muramoyltetrapeptide carboxypeptidase
MRMMDLVDWQPLLEHPKWLIGFSDITAIHCHVNRQLGLPTLHANMAGGINDPQSPANKSLWQALRGDRMQYNAEGHPLNRSGIGTGMLVGGNLSLISATLGSPSELQTDGRLLLIEDVSEYKYTIDRLLMTLKRAGKLNKLAGLLVGGFTATKEENEPGFPMTVEDIILEKVKEFHYPVCFNFPAGHIKNNLAIKLGVHYNLYASYSGSALSEVEDPHPPLPAPPNALRP